MDSLREICPIYQSKNLDPITYSISCKLFEDQVKKRPDETAVIFKNIKLTYRDLDQRSNQVAKYLRENGVQTETLVGLSLGNSLNLIVGILGILKAGGVYLPLEPIYPRNRLDYMLADAKPPVLLTESALVHQFNNFSGKIIKLDEVWKEISTLSCNALDVSIKPNHLAYVIYTSGSTGRPKAIMVEHGSFAHGAVAHHEFYQGNLVGLLSAGISFDVSILIVFYLLLTGGTIYVPPGESTIDADKLIDLIETNSINFILCVPSLYSMILSKSRKLPSLKIVSLAGENIPNSILSLHSHFAPNAILYNEYGPTEYAIGTTIATIYDPIEKKTNSITVGKPLPKTRVYILDEQFRFVATGVKGEIFIGGPGLARGYLNKPDLTSEKFILFQSEILYRTGDFGRFLPDGNLEFLGRADHQIKIRGHRVELGEIEHVLCLHPKVNEAVVVVREEPNENKHLIAYYTALVKHEIRHELKAYLTSQLPKFMIPSAFVQLESFPRTPNGKIDRNALPNELDKEKDGIDESRSDLERALSEIWKTILNLRVVGNQDNFFDVGGDSLNLVRLQILIETNLSAKVSITELLQYPTISQLSWHINQKANSKIIPVHHDLLAKKNAAFQRFKLMAGPNDE
jgi:amino acid adenylation domain-containing protein